MALPHEKFREIVFQLLYSDDFSESVDSDMLPFLMEQLAVTKKNLREAQARKQKIIEMKASLDQEISASSTSYTFDRIPGIERNILRLGLYEILHDPEVPPKVAISEGIRLARKFATPEGATFVNAILDSVYKRIHGSVSTV